MRRIHFRIKMIRFRIKIINLGTNLYRNGILDIKLFGYINVPAFPEFFQNSKERIEITESENSNLERITDELLDQLAHFPENTLIILGPGSTFEY